MCDGCEVLEGFQWAGVGSHSDPETVRPICSAEDESGMEVKGFDEDEETFDEGAVRGPRHVRDILTPFQEEVERHNLTHLPFRNWCPRCMKGRGKEAPHRRVEGGRVTSQKLAWTLVSRQRRMDQEHSQSWQRRKGMPRGLLPR